VDWLIARYRAGRDALAAGTAPPAEAAPRPPGGLASVCPALAAGISSP
jgi:hypothetical protein